MIDPIRIQALVDGECSAAERRRLLSQIENQPERWRELALALLEEQAFRSEIGSMRAVVSEGQRDGAQKVPLVSLKDGNELGVLRAKKRWYAEPVLAACLMLSIGVAIGRFVMRRIAHEKFKNISSRRALAELQDAEVGDYVFRPSTRSENSITLTWKFFKKHFVHIDIIE